MLKKRKINKNYLVNNKDYLLKFYNSEMAKFIEAITICLKFKKHMIFYYDISIYPVKDQNRMSDFLKEIYQIFPYIIFITNYIPGYISNRFSPSLTIKAPLFEVFVFLNYDSKFLKHRVLLNELSRYLYPTVVFSKPGDLEISKFTSLGSVISNVFLDLTNLVYFKYISELLRQIIFKILKLNIKSTINYETAALTPEEAYLLGLAYSLYIFFKPGYLEYLLEDIKKELNLIYDWKVQTPNDFIFLLTKESDPKYKFMLKNNNPLFFETIMKNSVQIKKLILKLIKKKFDVVFLHMPPIVDVFIYK
jgi:hypothetical protein